MANETKDVVATPAKKADLVAEIGTLTYPKAVRYFGDNALEVMKQTAAIGGHGLFEEGEFTSPVFGGLAMPNKNVAMPDKASYANLPDADFWFAEAKRKAEDAALTVETRYNAINELFHRFKK